MKYLKNILASFFIVVGLFTLTVYVLGVLSIEIGGHVIPMGYNFSIEFWGVLSALFLFIGGVLMLKNNNISALFLIASILMYFLGATVPYWSNYGFGVFENVVSNFYLSLSIRIILTLVAIYALRKVLAANKSLKNGTPESGAP